MKNLCYSLVIVSVVLLALFPISQLSTAQNKGGTTPEVESTGLLKIDFTEISSSGNIWTPIDVSQRFADRHNDRDWDATIADDPLARVSKEIPTEIGRVYVENNQLYLEGDQNREALTGDQLVGALYNSSFDGRYVLFAGAKKEGDLLLPDAALYTLDIETKAITSVGELYSIPVVGGAFSPTSYDLALVDQRGRIYVVRYGEREVRGPITIAADGEDAAFGCVWDQYGRRIAVPKISMDFETGSSRSWAVITMSESGLSFPENVMNLCDLPDFPCSNEGHLAPDGCSPASGEVNNDLVLRLPWQSATQYPVTQGYCGSGHMDGYRVDFGLPSGSSINATAAGILSNSQEYFSNLPSPTCPSGNVTTSCGGTSSQLNGTYVKLWHQGSTHQWFSWYLHLTPPLPAKAKTCGAVYSAREFIANSGNTGCSSGPHLHFQMNRAISNIGYRPTPMRGIEISPDTWPITFFTAGKIYQAPLASVAPSPITPANNSAGQSTTPTFSWPSVAGATSYRIVVGTIASALEALDDPTSTGPTEGSQGVVINRTAAPNNYTHPFALAAGTTYYWRVKGRSGFHGDSSARFQFTTAGGPTPTPSPTPTPTPTPTCPSPSGITIGQTINGTLQSGDCLRPDTSYYDAYTFNGTAGQQIFITLNSSQFNAFLFLYQGSYPGGTLRASDDNGGGGTNARIPATSGFFTLPTSGTYTILANSLAPGESGSYSLFLGGPTCNPPGAFAQNAPSDGASLSSTTSMTLSWGASANADSYDVYFGTTSNPPFLANQTGTSRTVIVAPGQTYWWKVVAKSNCTSATSTTVTWSFSIQQACNTPGSFSLTSPSNGQSVASTTSVDLTWGASANANSYDVYFGTGTNPPLIANQPGRSRTVTVTPGQTYRWKIVSRVSCGSATFTTPIWSFSVQQSACTYSIPLEQTIAPGTGNVTFDMTAPAGCAWSAVSDSPWLTTSSSGSGTGTLRYDYNANPNPSPRIGHITVGGKVHTVTQLPLGGTGVVRFAGNGDIEVNERIRTAKIAVLRNFFGQGAGTVQYSTSDGTAIGGLDYVPTFGTLFFDEFETLKFFDVEILEDRLLFEANETFTISLSDPSPSFMTGNPSTATVTIINDPLGLRRPFDFDGDARADYSVFRPGNGAWYLQRSTDGYFAIQFGAVGDKLAPADFDGDGKTDIAVYRPSAGQWYVLNSATATVSYPVFGVAEDLPAPGDYDGDGKADLTVFRPSQGTWYRQNSSNGSFFGMQFGANGDVPTVGDFDGDGKNDLGIWRPSNGDWYHIRSSNGSVFGERFGQTGDRIAPADYDGDGKTDIAIFRPSTGLWVVRNSATATYSYSVFGAVNDVPVSGDYDGDGKADIGVWRPSDGTWYVQRSSNGSFLVFPWGQNGDRPTPSAYGN